MSFESWIELGVFLYFVGRWLFSKVSKEGEPAQPSVDTTATPPDPSVFGLSDEAVNRSVMLQQQMEVLAERGSRGVLARARARRLLSAFSGDEAFQPFAKAITEHILPQLEEVDSAISAAISQLQSAPGAMLVDPASMEEVDALLRGGELRIRLVDEWWGQRAEPMAREVLGDADALGRALQAPIMEFAERRALDFEPSVPVCAHWDHGLALSQLFLGTGVAPVLLPTRFAVDVGVWPVLAHEIGHSIYFAFPGLADEMFGALRVEDADADLDFSAYQPNDDLIRAPMGRWLPELFADVIGALMLGPGFVAAHRRELATPDEPINAVVAAAREGGGLDEHPPAHVRFKAVTAVLDEMGHHALANSEWARWDAAHEHPEAIFLPGITGAYTALPAEALLADVVRVVQTLLRTQYTALASMPLMSVPGLSFGRDLEERAAAVATGLLEGRATTEDPRVVVAAAVAALEAEPEKAFGLPELVRRSILGIGTTERPSPKATAVPRTEASGGPAADRRPAARWPSREDWVEALLLSEVVLSRPSLLTGGPR